MRAVRYTGAAITAGVLAVAVAAVAVGHTDRTASSSIAVRVDAGLRAGAATGGTALRIHITAGTDGAMLLTVDGRVSDGSAASRGVGFRGRPPLSGIRVAPDLGSGSLTADFTTADGILHRLRADLRATGAADAWTEGPYAPGTGDVVAALRACDARAVPVAVDLFFDGIAVPTDPVLTSAEIVARTCSTVVVHR
jgi:hypothetical protein